MANEPPFNSFSRTTTTSLGMCKQGFQLRSLLFSNLVLTQKVTYEVSVFVRLFKEGKEIQMRTSADAVVAAGVRFKSNKFTRSITIFNTG